MPVSVEYQKRIRELVAESDKNSTELAGIIGIDARSFSLSIQYGIIPSTRTLIRIANYFQVSIAYLVGKNNNEMFYPSETASDFFTRITELCADKELTFYKTAIECHLDKSCISRWVRLKTLPTLELLEIVADYFNVSIDYLLGRTDEKD